LLEVQEFELTEYDKVPVARPFNPLAPAADATTVTGYEPKPEYAWLTVGPAVEDVPSPKFQYQTGLLMGTEGEAVKVIVCPACPCPLEGVAETVIMMLEGL
jgi:hypothetical protein